MALGAFLLSPRRKRGHSALYRSLSPAIISRTARTANACAAVAYSSFRCCGRPMGFFSVPLFFLVGVGGRQRGNSGVGYLGNWTTHKGIALFGGVRDGGGWWWRLAVKNRIDILWEGFFAAGRWDICSENVGFLHVGYQTDLRKIRKQRRDVIFEKSTIFTNSNSVKSKRDDPNSRFVFSNIYLHMTCTYIIGFIYRHNFQTWISHENTNRIVQKKSEHSINIYGTLDVRVFPKNDENLFN